MSDRIQQILQDLGRAVAGAMHGADPVHDVVRRLRRHGYEFEMLLDLRVRPEDDPIARLGVGALQISNRVESPTGQSESPQLPETDARADVETPAFRLDADDARFLRDLGIDPTRTGKSRRR